MKYFTITTYEHAGLGDQLGTQFSRLFKIGESLKLDYLHKEFKINRSCKSNYQINIQSFFLTIKKLFIPLSIKFSFFIYVLKLILLVEKFFLKFEPTSEINKRLKKFLGINSSEKYKKKTLQPDLFNSILNSTNKNELLQSILKISEYNNYECLELIWLPNYYDLSYKLDDLFNDGKTINENSYLKECFYKNRKISKNDINKKIVIHVRCGDSVLIEGPSGTISLYGNEVTFLQNEIEKNRFGDLNRKSINFEKYLRVLDSISIPNNTNVILLSDGFESSKHIICDYFIKNSNKLEKEKKQILIDILNVDLNKNYLIEPFKNYCNSFIIGESFQNLKLSILELSQSDILFFGTGGFAYYIHSIYRKNTNSYLGHANEKPQILIDQFNKILN